MPVGAVSSGLARSIDDCDVGEWHGAVDRIHGTDSYYQQAET